MKKIFLFALLISSFGFAQQTGNRYLLLPEGGGYYQVPNKEIQNPIYASSLAITTTHEETTINVGQLSGNIAITSVVTNCYLDDKLTFILNANSSNQTATFSTGFITNGNLPVLANTYAIINFQFNGTKWFEVSRQNLSSISKIKTSTTYTASVDTITSVALQGGIINAAATGTVAPTLTLPTATAIATQLGATVGTTYDFVLLNIGTNSGTGTATIAVNTGITASTFPGTNTLTLAESPTTGIALFRLSFISSTVATLTRIN